VAFRVALEYTENDEVVNSWFHRGAPEIDIALWGVWQKTQISSSVGDPHIPPVPEFEK
jgi:hypothetical protein